MSEQYFFVRKLGLGKEVVSLSLVITEVFRAGGMRWWRHQDQQPWRRYALYCVPFSSGGGCSRKPLKRITVTQFGIPNFYYPETKKITKSNNSVHGLLIRGFLFSDCMKICDSCSGKGMAIRHTTTVLVSK